MGLGRPSPEGRALGAPLSVWTSSRAVHTWVGWGLISGIRSCPPAKKEGLEGIRHSS